MKRILTRKPASWLLAAVLLLTCAALGFNAQTAYAEGGPVITKQPSSTMQAAAPKFLGSR